MSDNFPRVRCMCLPETGPFLSRLCRRDRSSSRLEFHGFARGLIPPSAACLRKPRQESNYKCPGSWNDLWMLCGKLLGATARPTGGPSSSCHDCFERLIHPRDSSDTLTAERQSLRRHRNHSPTCLGKRERNEGITNSFARAQGKNRAVNGSRLQLELNIAE